MPRARYSLLAAASLLLAGCAGPGLSAGRASRLREKILKPVDELRPLPEPLAQEELCRASARWEDFAGNPDIPGAVYIPSGPTLAEREKQWYCGDHQSACLEFKPAKDEKTGNIILDERCFNATFYFYMRALGSGEQTAPSCELFMKGGDIQNSAPSRFCELLRGAVERGESALCAEVMETVPGMELRCQSLVATAGGKPGCSRLADEAARDRCLEAAAIVTAFRSRDADLCEGRALCLALFHDPQICGPAGAAPRPAVFERAKTAYCQRKARTDQLAAISRLHTASLKAIDELNSLAIELSFLQPKLQGASAKKAARVMSDIQGSILELRQNIERNSAAARP